MKIPMRKAQPAIEFNEFMDLLQEKYKFNYRDMAGKFSKEARDETNATRTKWMNENGFAGKEHVMDVPNPTISREDWPKDSPEMADRIAINTGFRSSEKVLDEIRPYQDVWHWLLDNDFSELRRGGDNSIYLGDERLNPSDEDKAKSYYREIPDYVMTVLRAIRAEVEDSPAFDGESVTFHVDW